MRAVKFMASLVFFSILSLIGLVLFGLIYSNQIPVKKHSRIFKNRAFPEKWTAKDDHEVIREMERFKQ